MIRLALISLLLFALPAAAFADADYDTKGFEPPTFKAGSIDKQGGWRVVNVGGDVSDAIIQNKIVHKGKHALALTQAGRRIVARYRKVLQNTFYMDLWAQLPSRDTIKSNATIRLRGRDGDNKAAILLNVSFNGGGSVNGVPAGKYKSGQWTRITIKVDFDSQSWSLYLDGKSVGAGLPFYRGVKIRRIDTFDLDWTSKPDAPGGGLIVDDLRITAENPLDQNKTQP